MKPVLFEVQDLSVRAGNFMLSDISFSLEAGQYFIVLGPTGCGKTMLLETLAGLRNPIRGEIFLQGQAITSLPPEARQFGFAYQDSLLYPFLTVKENIFFGARAQKRHQEQEILHRADNLVEVMGIAALLDRYPSSLSGGEKQRVSLARALLTYPPLLLLDEPLASLDPQTHRSMQELLREIHRKEGLGIIHVTHDFNEALQLGTDLLVMNHGKVLQQGKPSDVFLQPSSLDIANFLLGENLLEGTIEWREGRAWFKQDGSDLAIGPLDVGKIPKKEAKKITLLIRAGDLMLSRQNENEHTGHNSWCSVIERIEFNSTHIEVVCAGQGRYRVILSRSEWKRLDLQIGSPVRISVHTDDIHIIQN